MTGSPFSRRAAAVGAPLGKRLNGEPVVLYDDDGLEFKASAIVDLDEIPTAAAGFVELEGRMSILTADLTAIQRRIELLRIALIRGKEFDVYGRSVDHFGQTVFNVRRRNEEESEYTNLYDLHGRQIPLA